MVYADNSIFWKDLIQIIGNSARTDLRMIQIIDFPQIRYRISDWIGHRILNQNWLSESSKDSSLSKLPLPAEFIYQWLKKCSTWVVRIDVGSNVYYVEFIYKFLVEIAISNLVSFSFMSFVCGYCDSNTFTDIWLFTTFPFSCILYVTGQCNKENLHGRIYWIPPATPIRCP